MSELDKSLGEPFARTSEQMQKLRSDGVAAAKRMIGFIDASPTPYHAVANVAAQLEEDGFVALREEDAWTIEPGARRYVVRGESTIIAFQVGTKSPAEAGYRIIGAHTDSPTLRVKPRPEISSVGHHQLGVEVYGGVLLSTWLDRDLSIAGRVHLLRNGNVVSQLVDLRQPVARISNLAIHLDRKVNTDGLKLNEQKHLAPTIALSSPDCDAIDIKSVLGDELRIAKDSILGHDMVLYDTQKGSLGGLHDELVYSARLDNLASCFAATEALCGAPDAVDATAVMVLYDHEECGSRSAIGAGSNFLRDVLMRIAVAYPDGQVQAISRAMARSLLVSADMAHAVHPNHSDKHDAQHAPRINRGLVLKYNANQSYTTSGATAAQFGALCREVGFVPQEFVVRSDLPCGSTIGPIASANLGMKAVDVGAPMLSMHSCREVAGTLDVHLAQATYQQLFR
jgi:aspartyl aminopeptidase